MYICRSVGGWAAIKQTASVAQTLAVFRYCIYLYIYTYICICLYGYIYIYMYTYCMRVAISPMPSRDLGTVVCLRR